MTKPTATPDKLERAARVMADALLRCVAEFDEQISYATTELRPTIRAQELKSIREANELAKQALTKAGLL